MTNNPFTRILLIVVGITFFLLSSIVGATEVGYLGVKPSHEYNCKLFPVESFVARNYAYKLRSPIIAESEIDAYKAILDRYEARYKIDDRVIYIPCEYYSDTDFLLNLSSKALKIIHDK